MAYPLKYEIYSILFQTLQVPYINQIYKYVEKGRFTNRHT